MRSPCLALLLLACPAAAEPLEVAVFDFELIDTSLEGELMGPREDEAARLAALGETLRAAYAEAPDYRVLDLAPVRDRALARNLQNCGGCAATLGKELGAEMVVTGTVQKVSNLILNINLYVEGPDGRRAMSADIRGNTDESWARGLDWLIRNRLGL
jgi:hypothetical protein